MSNVTEYLFALGAGIIARQREYTPGGEGYEMADSGAVECEVGEFLYGLARVLKPERVLTTGVYTGLSDLYLAQAIKDNGRGHIWAVEYEAQHVARAKRLWQRCGVEEHITVVFMDSRFFVPSGEYQLMFLDTEPDLRFGEMERFYPHLAPGGFVGIHDLPRSFCQNRVVDGQEGWPFGPFPERLARLVRAGELSPFHLPNPRGCVFFYKRHRMDYLPHAHPV